MVSLTPIANNLWTDEQEPRLIGGRHKKTGTIVFPCPIGSEADDFEQFPLSRRGTLWSWTIQSFRPKSPPYSGPEGFTPFGVGYIELPGEVIVESPLTRTEGLRIGMPMVLTIIPFDGQRATFAFTPEE